MWYNILKRWGHRYDREDGIQHNIVGNLGRISIGLPIFIEYMRLIVGMYIFCSKALAEALKINKKELKKIPDTEIVDAFYSWHGHIAKVQGKNTIVLMNDKTKYSLIFRNKLPRKAEKLVEMIPEAIAFTMEVGGLNHAEIEKYMEGVGEIVFAEKPDRQMTGNLTRMMLDMEYTGHRWVDDETVQAYQAAFENNLLRKLDNDYIKPFELMLDEMAR